MLEIIKFSTYQERVRKSKVKNELPYKLIKICCKTTKSIESRANDADTNALITLSEAINGQILIRRLCQMLKSSTKIPSEKARKRFFLGSECTCFN